MLMKRTILMDDDYKPKAGDVVLVLWDEGVMFDLRLLRQSEPECPHGCCVPMWIGQPTTGEPTEVEIDVDDIFGEVIG